MKAPGKACLGSRLVAGFHPRQDSWVDDSDAAPLLPTLVALQETADRVETADVFKGGIGLEYLHLYPKLLFPTPYNILGAFPASFLRTSGGGLEPELWTGIVVYTSDSKVEARVMGLGCRTVPGSVPSHAELVEEG